MGMHKYDRLMFILNSLRSRKNLSAAKLAEECGVTERSIYRDILSLSEANVPIYYDRGYKLASDNFLPPLNFDLDEYNCLQMALDSTPLIKTDKYQALVKRIRAKVEVGLSEAVKSKRRFSVPATQLDIPVTAAIDEPGLFSQIEHAIQEDRCLEIVYDSVETGESKRIVEPYFIVFRIRAFYFVAYCRKTKDFRTFRIDRIKKITELEETFSRKSGVNAESYFDGSWGIYTGEKTKVTVLFRGSAAKVILSGKHHNGEEVDKLKDGSVRYHVTTRGIEEIQRWIVGFGGEAEVVEPKELRDNLNELGQQLLKRYSSK